MARYEETFEEARQRKKIRRIALNITGVVVAAVITFIILSVVP